MAGEHEQAEVNEFERALRTLAPAASRMDRDRLMFLAGRASAERGVGRSSTPSTLAGRREQAGREELRPTERGRSAPRWLWPAATVVSTSCALIFGVLLVLRAGGPAAGVGDLADRAERPVAERPDAPRANETESAAATAARADVDPPVDAGTRTARPQPSARPSVDRHLAFGFASRDQDPDRLPVYLRLRQLVLEQGVEALSPSSPRGSAETIADAHPVRSPTLRAIDRPGRTDTGDGDVFDAGFPAGDAGRL